jgi:hypothetical protein
MFNEAKESLEKNLSDKLVSPFWGTFISSWCAWNWKAWYITFFVDSELLMQSKNILKIDYILSYYPSNHFLAIAYSVTPPLVASYFIVFWLPKLTKIYYAKALGYEYDNRITKDKRDKDFYKAIGEKLEIEKNVLIKKAEVEKEKVKSEKSQAEIWNEEYEQLKNTKYYPDLKLLKESVYIYDGKPLWDYDKYSNQYKKGIPTDSKAYFDVDKIIQVKKEGLFEKIHLTEKGKYFIKKYSENN